MNFGNKVPLVLILRNRFSELWAYYAIESGPTEAPGERSRFLWRVFCCSKAVFDLVRKRGELRQKQTIDGSAVNLIWSSTRISCIIDLPKTDISSSSSFGIHIHQLIDCIGQLIRRGSFERSTADALSPARLIFVCFLNLDHFT